MKAVEVRLRPHPGQPFGRLDEIVVQVVRPAPGRLALRYEARGDIGSLALPMPAAPTREDELWRHTCFEAFVRSPASNHYIEINLSPSSQWAAYAFSDYRRQAVDPDISPPAIRCAITADAISLAAELDVSKVPRLDDRWALAISAVIEDKRGERSYWALAHPPGQPDFHHISAFTLNLPRPD